ncbi:MAG: SH3 domain-containing protein [Lachnospiraceae bacterium]|jgi:uncharacterized protein YgiM (DUF1202 family)|nr:SH3 domain-containing protein [Lachnospiraceae bacterium]MCI1657312.1 SH3 domain-containing protein [Lachnospiraceae bacterium]MCI2195790.1 SH3 domain-containing protein [Lachnospiraceae bacterium]
MRKMKKKLVAIGLAAATILTAVPAMPAQAASASYAVKWAVATAADKKHGYSQSRRWGNPDYDCSSFVISAYKAAGIPTGGASCTADMRSSLTSVGFKDYSASELKLSTAGTKYLKAGDILWRYGHVELYAGNGKIVGAHKNIDGRPGDSTGQEISTKPFYSRSWTHVLRYQGSESSADTASTASAQTYAKGTYKVTAGSLNIRSQASNTSEVVGTVTRGYTVTVTSTSGRWGRFLYNGTPAWISLKYCEPAASAPTEVTVPTTRFTGKSSTKKKVTVRWSRVSGISGYRIAYKKKGAAKYTIKNLSAKKTSLTISAQSRKNYVFRIRTYVKVNGKKYSSPYVHAYTVKAK